MHSGESLRGSFTSRDTSYASMGSGGYGFRQDARAASSGRPAASQSP